MPDQTLKELTPELVKWLQMAENFAKEQLPPTIQDILTRAIITNGIEAIVALALTILVFFVIWKGPAKAEKNLDTVDADLIKVLIYVFGSCAFLTCFIICIKGFTTLLTVWLAPRAYLLDVFALIK